MITLRRFRQLVVLAEEGSFTRAARRLGMTQPALSRSLALLEQEAGLLLFERTASGVVPTMAGKELLRDARRILGNVDVVEHNLRLQGTGQSGAVNFAIGPLAANYLLARILSRSVAHSPALSLSTEVIDTSAIIEGVCEGKYDFGICTANTFKATDELIVRPVATLQMVLVVRSRHPLLGSGELAHWDDLRPYPRATGRVPGDVQVAVGELPNLLETTVQCNDFEVLRKVTLTTDTIWLTARETVQGDIAGGRLVEIEPIPAARRPDAEIVLVTLRGRSVSPAANRIMTALSEV